MSLGDTWRLETKDGQLIAMLVPNFGWEPTATNDITEEGLPGKEQQALVLDLSQWLFEITVQGDFADGQNLHATEVQTLVDEIPIFNTVDDITATKQVQYAFEKLVFDGDIEPPYNLYLGEWEFTAETFGEWQQTDVNVFPNVVGTELRTPEQAGIARSEYLFKFTVGFERS